MRKSKLKASEIEAQQLAEHKEQTSRRDGYAMMPIRDNGAARLSNATLFFWHVPDDKRRLGVPYRNVPEGHFVLEISGRSYLFDADEFRKWLRWC